MRTKERGEREGVRQRARGKEGRNDKREGRGKAKAEGKRRGEMKDVRGREEGK